MNAKKLLRFLIVIEIVTLLVGAMISVIEEKYLPVEIQSYLRAQDEIPVLLPFIILAGLFLFLKAISNIGIFCLWRHARFLYLLVTVIDIIGGVFTGDGVEPVLGRAFFEACFVINGLILGLLYFSDAKVFFEKKGHITRRCT